MQLFISEIQLEIESWESDFHIMAVHFLAKHKANTRDVFLICSPIFVTFTDKQTRGSNGKGSPRGFVIILVALLIPAV